MSAAKEFERLKLATRPKGDRAAWLLSAGDSIKFLAENAESSDILLYASMPNAYIEGVLAPLANVTPPDINDLLRAYVDPDDAWAIQRSYGGGEDHRVYLEPPMSYPGCNSLVGSEKLVFRRSFTGLAGYKPPTELNQKLVHALELHFLESHGAYCKLNDDGDLVEVISVFEEDGDDEWGSTRAVFIRQRELAEYMALSEAALFRKFDFTRVDHDNFEAWDQRTQKTKRLPDLSYNAGAASNGSYVNGYHVARTNVTKEELVEEWKRSLDRSTRKYETFKIQDFKNGVLTECSGHPDSISNYFTKSDKPFETSPVFFRPEVLHKYKADPDKYAIEHRSITCRNSWYLKSFDVNEEGQVHTYIGDLAALPYAEQQYWKLYNEWPKGPISKRAFQTDFEGDFSTEPDPLMQLEHIIGDLEKGPPVWWLRRLGAARPKVLYPATTSSKEWSDEILALDQLVVEGLSLAGLKGMAANLSVPIEKGWGSLKVLEECLAGIGIRPERAKTLVEPLKELHHLRSKVKGHATGEGKKLEKAAQKRHGSLRAHFTDLAQRCADSFEAISTSLQTRLPRGDHEGTEWGNRQGRKGT